MVAIMITLNDLNTPQDIEYYNYIQEHIKNVREAFETYGNILCNKLEVSEVDLGSNVDRHDLSKFSEEEFIGYRKRFYPIKGEFYIEDIFNKAWFHHIKKNPHHPEYWSYADDDSKIIITTMEPIYIAEMLLDWSAMGKKFNDTPYKYWIEKGDTKPFNPVTRKLVNEIVPLFK